MTISIPIPSSDTDTHSHSELALLIGRLLTGDVNFTLTNISLVSTSSDHSERRVAEDGGRERGAIEDFCGFQADVSLSVTDHIEMCCIFNQNDRSNGSFMFDSSLPHSHSHTRTHMHIYNMPHMHL